MAKQYYCSYCGTKLIVTRKALPNKGYIIELVEPHDCDERNVENITDAAKPVSPDIREMQIMSKVPPPEDEDNFPTPEFRDRRDKKDIKSTAPFNVLTQLDPNRTSSPENQFNDIDED